MLGLLAGQAGAAVYETHGVDGMPAYTSDAYDGTHRLIFADEAPASLPVAPVATAALPKLGPIATQRLAALEPIIRTVAQRHQVDSALVRAIAHVESRFNERALSPKGATGVMQLMPATGARYGVVDRRDAAQNIDAAVRYFKDLLTRFNGNVALALAAYNAGEGAVDRHGKRIPPYRETMLYVPEVLLRYEGYRRNALAH